MCIRDSPRTVAQAEILDRMLEKEGTPLKGLICIHVPFEELKRRMLERAKIEGRADDNEEAIAKRFREYNDKTVHVANHYKKKGVHIDVEGNCPVEEAVSYTHLVPGCFTFSSLRFEIFSSRFKCSLKVGISVSFC